MAINMGIPVAFFVSDPRLCVTEMRESRGFDDPEITNKLTPGNDKTNGRVGSAGYTEGRKVPDANIVVDSQEQPFKENRSAIRKDTKACWQDAYPRVVKIVGKNAEMDAKAQFSPK
ncbi:hypothetical protein DXG03_007924 [Asterophora parasitica]|uniref:Uncharacterized protein n=1 Tax=Asterophora parasitica TaxID=117018 RepID=A0A9P7KEC9_9AGAR|nr:hypothetical protein DXG03_007924 [Asterophora parasitica]